MDLLTTLSESEKKQWEAEIQTQRKRLIQSPHFFVEQIVNEGVPYQKENITLYIEQVRSQAYELYLKEEPVFHKHMINHLLLENPYASNVLSHAIAEHLDENRFPKQEDLAKVVGQSAGYLTPYIYGLCLSTTNSRRSRSGRTFEHIVKHVIDNIYAYPFQSQADLGNAFYKKNNLGKLVDGIMPSGEHFYVDRPSCVFITMKTSLRERWQEVVEEQQRTNIPIIYLLTLDPSLSENTVKRLAEHNIYLVLPFNENQKFSSFQSVLSFEQFFNDKLRLQSAHWHL